MISTFLILEIADVKTISRAWTCFTPHQPRYKPYSPISPSPPNGPDHPMAAGCTHYQHRSLIPRRVREAIKILRYKIGFFISDQSWANSPMGHLYLKAGTISLQFPTVVCWWVFYTTDSLSICPPFFTLTHLSEHPPSCPLFAWYSVLLWFRLNDAPC